MQQNRRREFEDASADPALSLRLTTGTLDVRLHHRPIGRVFGTVGASGFVQTNETLAEETLIPARTTLNGALYVAEQLVLSGSPSTPGYASTPAASTWTPRPTST